MHASASSQALIARDGGTIAHVQQTIVQGDLYTIVATLPADLEALYGRYCTFLIESFGTLDFRGIMQVQHVARLPLEEIYIPLSASAASAPEGCNLHDLVRDTPYLVVLGDPGAGKSTLVRSLLLALARNEGHARLGMSNNWLPIFFPVAAFAEARRRAARADLSPLDYLGEYYAGLSQPDYQPLFRRALEAGQALVMLDGLDEVRDDRMGMIRYLDAFVREWDAPGNRFVATSRIAGYDEAPLDPTLFLRAVIQPLSDDQIRRFLVGWSLAYMRMGETSCPAAAQADRYRQAAAHADQLEAEVFANRGVTELARNPLLLTILALIQNQGARLPDRRVDLYRLCVEALAETWNRARSLSGREVDVYLGDEKLGERFVVNLLGPAALWIHGEQPGGLVDQRTLERHLAQTLTQTDGLPRGRAQRLAEHFIELMRRDTGLLQERGYRRFGFLHLTFEEYLAARALLESVTVTDSDGLIHRYASDPRWHEVLRLAVAAAPQREAQRLILHLLAAPTTAETLGRPIVLAGECLLDIGRNGATQRAWAAGIGALVALINNPAAAVEARVAGGRVLGQLGDPRLLDLATGQTDGYWCPVAAGSFWYGAEGGARTAALCQIDDLQAFRIARYPVTNAEFRRFIAAGGYHDPRWWSTEGHAFLRTETAHDPSATLRQPGLWENAQYNNPSQPVVGVSWYEALAYGVWLTAHGRQVGWLGPYDELRLPTAIEWERAARHTDQRRYPWGDAAPTSNYANYELTNLRAPSPVGCFPAGAALCGACDLAGNVWEWTASRWEAPLERIPRRDLRPNEMPIIRGGAFNWNADYLACSARYWFNPCQRYNLLGFRLVWMSGDAQ